MILFVQFLLLVDFGYEFIYSLLSFLDGEMSREERMSNDTR